MFTKNRDRLLEGDIAAKFFRAVLGRPEVKALLSDEHFSVDGTLIEAWASLKSFKPKQGDDEPPAGGSGRRLAPTRATMRPASPPAFVRSTSRRTSPSTRRGAPPWTVEPRAIPGMP